MKPSAKPSKFLNKKTVVDGIEFDSIKESRRYGELKLLERAGEIKALCTQTAFPLMVNGVRVASYKADFVYLRQPDGSQVIEDVKSPFTRKNPVYRLKAKIMAAMGQPIVEV